MFNSCHPLSLFREAIEHFLTALSLQQQAQDPSPLVPRGTAQMSESVWSTLRLAITFHGRNDLLGLVDARNLDALTKEFGINA